MRKFTSEEIELFLKSIDSFLKKEVSVLIIGGTAAALAYKVTEATKDIDTWNSIEQLQEAYLKAKKDTRLEIPLGQVSVSDAPYNFEDRLKEYKPELFAKLKVIVPEVIDLILMKTIRGYSHDIDAIEQMVKNENVKLDDLTNRYINEMGSAVGNKRDIDLNFLGVVERCYGEKAAASAQKKIGFSM